jgi:hypothetical protein
MKPLIALVLLPVLVHAGPNVWAVYESPGLTVELYTSPCDYPRVKAKLEAVFPDLATRSAVVSHGGASFPGCWVFDKGTIVLADVTGNSGRVPFNEFKQDLV